MLKFEFSRRDETPPHGFDLGDLRVEGVAGVATSVGRTPDQGMMIYVAVSELLSGLHRFVLKRIPQDFEFIGPDSSFRLVFRPTKARRVGMFHRGAMIEEDTPVEVAKAALAGATRFLAEAPLSATDAVAGDIDSAIESLRAALADERHDALSR